jgi:ribosomal protein S12 methylthiotransferase
LRGKLASRPAGSVLAEAERLVEAGVRELLVISQDTSAYGMDLKYKLDFWGGRPVRTRMTELCRELGSLGAWVRLHYVYPYPHVDELIPLIADGLVLPYLDVPLQHGSPKVLRAMKRPAAAENALERIRKWRETCPEITLRSSFIVGFPGETDEDFEQLLDFITEAELDRVGCFQYSAVDGATANDLPGHVPGDVMAERERIFMETQAEISRLRLQAKVGSRRQVLVDAVGDEYAVGRSHADAPEIDGLVYVLDGQDLCPGDMVEVEISAADEYDLSGYIAGVE